PVTPPPFPDQPTWGNLGIWGDRLLDALESCNADKRAIAELDKRIAELTHQTGVTQ
ncbi:hypothetical protein LA268_005588, partial [Escherichia coli]|nr:hypothetical protein [Escherichia coli]